MGRKTNQAERQNRRKQNRTGFLLAIAMLLGAAELFGNGEATTPHVAATQDAKAPQHVLLVSIPDRKLAVTEDGHVLKVYDLAVGKASTPSPTGEMKIINKLVDPTYHHKGQVVRPGKSNPLGDRWMGLSEKGYGIHGTNVQSSIGKAASHGCFRMRKHDVEELFQMVRVGDVVEVRGERDAQWARLFVAQRAAQASTPATVAHVAATRDNHTKAQRAPQHAAVEVALMADALAN